MDEIDEILKGPDFFKCEYFNTTMLKQRCVERQEKFKDLPGVNPLNPGTQYLNETKLSLEKCVNCEQGEEIRVELMPGADNKHDGENTRICEECGENKTITPKHAVCSSCLGKRAWSKQNGARRTKKKALKSIKNKKETNDKDKAEKSLPHSDTSLTIEFKEYVSILEDVKKLATEELRPVDLQIIYMLKKQLGE